MKSVPKKTGAIKPPIAGLVDAFSDEFGSMSAAIIDDIKANLKAGKSVHIAVDLALSKNMVESKVKAAVLEKMVLAAAIGFRVEPSVLIDPVGIRASFLNANWPGDKLKLSTRIAKAEYRQLIVDTISGQMLRARSWSQTAEALSNPLKIGGGPNFTKADITARITDLAKAAHKVAPEDLASLAEFKSRLAAAKAHVNRLSLNGAPNQTLKTIYKQVIDAAEEMKLGALDNAMLQAVRDKARYNAERIARTETARAYGDAFDLKVMTDTDVVAVRIMLSTRHPKADICNFHTSADLYQMGPGVYPKGKRPRYPFHPHCMCVLSEIYEGEVEYNDKMNAAAGAKYIESLPIEQQRDLLGHAGAEAFAKEPSTWESNLRGWDGHHAVKPVAMKLEYVAQSRAEALSLFQERKDVEATNLLEYKQLKEELAKINVTAPPAPRTKVGKLIASDQPLSIADFEKVGAQAGSNPGGFYANKETGERWYFKEMDQSRAANEILAGKLYQFMGIDVPELQFVDMGTNRMGLGSRIVDGLHKGQGPLISEKVKGVVEGFGADAWLANWDVVGLGYDNMMLKGSGKTLAAIRVDTGGALIYRAQGGLKGAAFGSDVQEIRTLLDGSNPQSAAVFKNYSKAELNASLEKVTKLKDKDIRAIVLHYGPGTEVEKKALAKLLIERRNWIRKYLDEQVPAKVTAVSPSRITEVDVQRVRDSRINGYSIASDKDHIEDQQVLFWLEQNLKKEVTTNAYLKVRANGQSAMEQLVKSAKPNGPTVLEDEGLADKLVTAIKGIASRAAKGGLLEAKDIERVAEAQKAFKVMSLKLEKTVGLGLLPKTAAEEWAAHYSPWLQSLEDAVKPGVGTKAAWQTKTTFTPFVLPPLSVKTEAQAITFHRVDTRFLEKETRRGISITSNRAAYASGQHYEAEVRGATVKYWSNDSSTMYALRGRLEIQVKGEGVPMMENIYKVLDDLGINSTLTSAHDREELYLTQIAYHMRDEFKNFEWQTRDIEDQEKRVDKMRELVSAAIGKDVTKLKGYAPNGQYQAFGQGRIQLFRPDLAGKDWESFQTDYVLHHSNTNGDVAASLESILNAGGQMAPTADKLRRGIAPRGMSPSADLESGGASYFFTRIVPRETGLKRLGFAWKPNLVSRLDAISYESDMFGRTTGDTVLTKRRTGVSEWKKAAKGGSNETIFKNSLSLFDDLQHIVVSRGERDQVLRILKSHGYDKWPDGRSLDEVVIVAK